MRWLSRNLLQLCSGLVNYARYTSHAQRLYMSQNFSSNNTILGKMVGTKSQFEIVVDALEIYYLFDRNLV